MGVDLFTRRCGCGRILKAREGCGVCAEAKRASMYAKGVCSPEAMLARDAERVMAEDKAMHERALQAALKRLAPQAIHPIQRQQYDGVFDEVAEYKPLAYSQAEMERALGKRATVLSTPSVPAVGEQVDYARAIADMRARPEARYRNGAFGTMYRFDRVLMHGDVPSLIRKASDGDRWTRLPDASTKPQAPEVGAVVSYEEAKLDMQSNPDARYVFSASTYGWRDGVLALFHGREGGYLGPSKSAAKSPAGPWTKLA